MTTENYLWLGFWMIYVAIWNAASFGAALFTGGILIMLAGMVRWIQEN